MDKKKPGPPEIQFELEDLDGKLGREVIDLDDSILIAGESGGGSSGSGSGGTSGSAGGGGTGGGSGGRSGGK